jgi:hypothetical protein
MLLDDLRLVFIYLGEVIPEYVLENANRTSDQFNISTYLFVETKSVLPIAVPIHPSLNIAYINRKDFTAEYNSEHDLDFRQGFWVKTFERLLALKAIHSSFGGRIHLLHIESDMLLMPSFPFNDVLNEKIKWLNHNSYGDIASLVYSPSYEQSSWLYDKLLEEAKLDKKVTDMSGLSRIRSKYPEFIEIFSDMSSLNGDYSKTDIFDGLAFGLWFCGLDPRNTYGLHVLHENGDFKANSSRKLKDTLSSYSIELENEKFLCLKKEREIIMINSVHVHSKDRELFAIKNSQALSKYVEYSKDREVVVVDFNKDILLNLIKDNLLKGTLLSYFKHFVKFLFKKPGNGKSIALACVFFIFRKYK